jgi:hypothetical protein
MVFFQNIKVNKIFELMNFKRLGRVLIAAVTFTVSQANISTAQTQNFEITSQDKEYLEFVNDLLESKNNNLRYALSDSDKVRQAHVVCETLDSGQTVANVNDSAVKFAVTLETNSQIEWSEYIGTVIVSGVYFYCPNYRYQIEEALNKNP